MALADGKSGTMDYHANPRQFGAWRAYFKARRIPTHFMDRQGQAGKPWTVPAEWPHEFDADASVQADHEAGERFMRNYRPENKVYASEARRMATVAAFRRGEYVTVSDAKYEVLD